MPAFRALDPADPREIASYVITGRIGEGGQGVVYAAEAPSGDRVAVKLLHRQLSGDAQVRRAFGAELRQAQRVTSPRVARVLAYGLHERRLYYACEYIDGPALRELVARQGPRPAVEQAELALATLAALASIHDAGSHHGDLRPASVVMGPDGPRLIDLGAARALASRAAGGRPAEALPYTAPEQLAGTAADSSGPAADMFAWAGTMIFAASGRPPFDGDAQQAVADQILNGAADLSALGGRIRDAVAACLDKTPSRRPAARQLLERLQGVRLDPGPVIRPAAGDRPAAPPAWPEAPAAGAMPATGSYWTRPPAPDGPPTPVPLPEGMPATGSYWTRPPAPDGPPTPAPGGMPPTPAPRGMPATGEYRMPPDDFAGPATPAEIVSMTGDHWTPPAPPVPAGDPLAATGTYRMPPPPAGRPGAREYQGPIPLSSSPLWPRDRTLPTPAEFATDPAERPGGGVAAPPRPAELVLTDPPRRAARPARRRRRGQAVAAIGAAGGLLALAFAFGAGGDPGERPPRNVPGAAPPVPSPPAVSGTPEAASSEPPTAVPSPSVSPPMESVRAVPSWGTSTVRAPEPRLVVTPVKTRVDSDFIFYVNITLKARGGPVNWRASITEGSVLSSDRGTIKAGGSTVITAYGPTFCSTSVVRFTSNGGDRTVTITWGGVLC
ncbi:hypothetical protein Sru01_41480 [Sphaerisporangium rufum]|uniref:Protein kinase domain-containing protein n=1 Tax=Sphaerisporangium rufum TaxID=1381558 RepID=A0A919UZJ9_9ACTN|nr:serine/threonine-protein kinase [Sphaerisporangium rufum]GII79166.1 hypothetical protein Sru01_41480 [Sphaerisporangium rufum]